MLKQKQKQKTRADEASNAFAFDSLLLHLEPVTSELSFDVKKCFFTQK